jgi:DNA-directed RNA polymerase specialized sigma24 family protein
MASELMEPSSAHDGAICMTIKNNNPEEPSPVTLQSISLSSELSLPVLAARCLAEIDNYRRGEPYTERYGLELFHRALMQSDQEACTWVQHCFGGMVLGWVRRHPQRAVACRLESEEHYVAQAFERFWQATACNQQLEFRTLAAALQYLRASVHGAILDTLRTYQRPREASLPEPGAAEEPSLEDVTCDSEFWEILKGLFSNPREQRLAYLLFHCGLKPRGIVQHCSPEWSSVQEIYVLRRTIMERVLRHVDTLRWRLS